MQFKPPKDPNFRSQVQTDWLKAGMEETHWILWEYIIEAQMQQTKYASGREIRCVVGDNT
jgi:hypothetical protein